MFKLQRFLRACFANAALIYLMASVSAIPVLVSLPLPSVTPRFAHESLALKALAVILLVASRLILAIPLLLTAVFGMAWWQLKTAKPAARRWAMAASIVMLLSALPLLPAVYAMFHDSFFPHGIAATCTIVILASIAIGIAGIVAFSRRNAGAGVDAPSAPARIAGDGTHKTLDAIALILQIGGTLALVNIYTRWGYEHDLPLAQGLNSWVQWAVVILSVTFIHESAHAVVGLAVGMKLRAFVIGPFQWRVVEGRWKFEFRPAQMLAFSGAAGIIPTDPDQSRWNEVAMIAAGPFANLLTGGVAAALAYSAQDYSWRQFWDFFALFATISLVAGVVNMLPLRPESLYSDGARIYQLFRSGPLADYRRAVKSISATTVTPRGPKDYDIQAIERALLHFDNGEAALRLKLCSVDHFSDSGQFADACRALDEAEHLYHDSATDAPPDLLTLFVVNFVLLRRDASAAARWWRIVQGKKPTVFNADYWLAKCAFHWAENDPASAREAWKTGHAYLEKLPETGNCNYDRSCYSRMNEVLGTVPAEAARDSSNAPAGQDASSEVLPAPVLK